MTRSACTGQVVLILDGDARLFHDTANGGFARVVTFAVPTARPWGVNEGSLHGEGVVGCKLFIGVEFGCEGLEIRVRSFTAFFQFEYSERGGLEGVGGGTGLHGEVHGGMSVVGSSQSVGRWHDEELESIPRLSVDATSQRRRNMTSYRCLFRTFLQFRRAPTGRRSKSRRGLVPPPPIITRRGHSSSSSLNASS